MKKLIKFSALTKFSAVAAAVLAAVGVGMLLLLGGNTSPEFTFVNLGWGFALRVLTATIFTVVLTTVYYLICYRKSGLSDFTFPVMLLGVVLSYITSTIFFRSFGTDRPRGKKQSETEIFETAANKAFVPMLITLLVIALVAVGAFAVALVFKSAVLCLYVLPVILTAIFSVIFTLSVPLFIYTKKA